MLRAVLDVNVIISAILAPGGAPARVLRAWLDGSYEVFISPGLLNELERALAYPRVRAHVTHEEASELVALLRTNAQLKPDHPHAAPVHSADPADDYLIGLAEAAQAVLVSGDRHLLVLADRLPVYSPADFLALLGREP